MSTRYPSEPVNHTEEDIRRWALDEARKLITSPELRELAVPHSIPFSTIDPGAPATSSLAGPTGLIGWTLAATAPTGALLANGQVVSRTIYAALFGVIGTIGGVGDGSTTFGIPDMRDLMPIGAGTTYTLGATGGVATVTLTTAQIPSHAHTSAAHSHNISGDGLHTHRTYFWSVGGTGTSGTLGDSVNNSGLTTNPGTSADGNHAHGGATGATTPADTGSAGTGGSHTNLSPYRALTTFIWT